MSHRVSLADVAQSFFYGNSLIWCFRLVVIWSPKQGALNGACGRLVILGKGVDRTMLGCAVAHGR